MHARLPLLILSLFCANCFARTLFYRQKQVQKHEYSLKACSLSLAESIPENLTYGNSTVKHLSTFEAYQILVGAAVKELKIASLYWSLRGYDIMQNPGQLAARGEQLFSALFSRSRQIPMRIANNIGGLAFNHSDLDLMAQQPKVGLVWLNITGLLGDGVQHSKMMLADGLHAYVGSSNMDWRSLTQVKELGLLITECPTLVQELDKIFQTYWMVGKDNKIPTDWPDNLTAAFNATNPFLTAIGGHKYSIYIGVSPAQLAPPRWSRDIDAIVHAIESAREYVHIAVMDYQADLVVYGRHQFWGTIDNALRSAAIKGIMVRMLVSHWNHSNPYVKLFLDSLTALNGKYSTVEGKFFTVPEFTEDQRRIPFARVNHNKYMVTEDTAIICTSNWEGSYFTYTSGVSVSIKQLSDTSPNSMPESADPSIVAQVQAVFWRDWSSQYAHTTVPI